MMDELDGDAAGAQGHLRADDRSGLFLVALQQPGHRRGGLPDGGDAGRAGHEIQTKAIARAVKDHDPDKAFAVIKLAMSVEEISDAAMQIADGPIRDDEPHPVIAPAHQGQPNPSSPWPRSRKAPTWSGLPWASMRLANQSGMWVVAIKRGRKYIYGPDKTTSWRSGTWSYPEGRRTRRSISRTCASGDPSKRSDERRKPIEWDEDEVAPGRFELPSQDPESRMIDRYTTGLWERW